MQKKADPESDRYPYPHTQQHHEQKPQQGSHVAPLSPRATKSQHPKDDDG
jgi:hypothetical protein